MSEYYDHVNVPATGSPLSSATMRAEFAAIEQGFDKLPAMTGNTNKLVKVNPSGTALETTDTPDINGGTIDDAAVNLDGGSLVLPQGTAAAPTAEGQVYWNTSTDTLTVGNGAAAEVLVTENNAQTLTNKTINLASNTLSGTVAQFNAALSDGDFATLAGTETLTNKSINLANNTLTATSAQLAAAVTDKTGAGKLVFGTSPTLVEPVLGTGAGGSVTLVPQNTASNLTHTVLGDGDSLGASLVGYMPSGTGAVATTVQSKLRESVSVKDFGAAGDNVSDDSAEFQAAIDSLGASGGKVYVPPGVYRIASTITVNNNVSLVGDATVPGHINTPQIANTCCQLQLEAGVTITLRNASSVRGFLIQKRGTSWTAETSTTVTAWSGDALTLQNNTTDSVIEDCLIVGFNYAIRSAAGATNVSRTRIERVGIDCLNGVFLENSYDIFHLEEVNCWPYLTNNSTPEADNIHLIRGGTAFYFGPVNDWGKVTNCFAYGYFRGFHINGADNMTLSGCGADHSPGLRRNGSIGFYVQGASHEIRLIGCQAAAQTTGYLLSSTNFPQVTMIACDAWECDLYCVRNTSSRLKYLGGTLRSTVTTFDPSAVDTGTDTITLGSASVERRTGLAVKLSTTGTLPAPLVAGTEYWLISTDGQNIKLATSSANATNGIAIDLTTQGAGTHTLHRSVVGFLGETAAGLSSVVYGVHFDGCYDSFVTTSAAVKLIQRDCTFTGSIAFANTPSTKVTLASADPLVLDPEYTVFNVTGTTGFGTLNRASWFAGKQVTLIFSDALTVFDGNMRLNGNFTTTANDTLTLVSDGEFFYEVARSAN